MDIQQRMNELDARIAARKEAIDRKLGLSQAGAAPAPTAAEPDAARTAGAPSVIPGTSPLEQKSAPAPVAKDCAPTVKKPNRFDKPGILGVIINVLFVLTCLLTLLNIFWAVFAAYDRSVNSSLKRAEVQTESDTTDETTNKIGIGASGFGISGSVGYERRKKLAQHLGLHSAYEWSILHPIWVLFPIPFEVGFAYFLWWLNDKRRK